MIHAHSPARCLKFTAPATNLPPARPHEAHACGTARRICAQAVPHPYDRLPALAECIGQLGETSRDNPMALLNANDNAPAFSVPNQDGELRTLEDYRGKHLVLWWYPKANTPG